MEPTSPLNWLATFSENLVSTFEKACHKAEKQTRKTLKSLHKERTRLAEKRARTEVKLERALANDNARKVIKHRARLSELEGLHNLLAEHQQSLQKHLEVLQRDSQLALKLAQNIRHIGWQAKQAASPQHLLLPDTLFEDLPPKLSNGMPIILSADATEPAPKAHAKAPVTKPAISKASASTKKAVSKPTRSAKTPAARVEPAKRPRKKSQAK